MLCLAAPASSLAQGAWIPVCLLAHFSDYCRGWELSCQLTRGAIGVRRNIILSFCVDLLAVSRDHWLLLV